MRYSRAVTMLALVISGEAVFFLPFILPRIFRPTFLDVFGINNFELGKVFSAYGVAALLSYFLGGPLADRYPARKLMAGALAATGAGGLYLYLIPSYNGLFLLYAFWGMTTILLFWAAMIRATREWGGSDIQGKAFGFLEGGRGLAAVIVSTVGLGLLSGLVPESGQVDPAQREISFRNVILLFSTVPLAMSVVCWYAIPRGTIRGEPTFRGDFDGLLQIIRMRRIWLLAVILVSAYVSFKITDNFSLYARDVLNFDEVKSARIGTFFLFLRPVVAVSAGFLADRFLSSRLIVWGFVFLVIGGLLTGIGILPPGIALPHFLSLVVICLGAYSLRIVYYSVMEEAGIPLALTGTAVGVISVIGYTPDIFIGPLMGWLLDRSPGVAGHEHVFLLLTGFGVLGLLAALIFRKQIKDSI